MLDLAAYGIIRVFQCLNLLERSDCEQANGRAGDGSLLDLRTERTTENIHRISRRTGNSHVSFPVQCHLQYPHPLPPNPPSALSTHTVPQHASPGQDERV